MTSLIARFTLRAGAGPAFDVLVEQLLDGIRQCEPRTLAFVVHVPEGRPHVRVFYEVYDGPDALEEHRRQRHTVDFSRGKVPLVVGPVEVEFMERIGPRDVWQSAPPHAES